jgi:hypothetical protein
MNTCAQYKELKEQSHLNSTKTLFNDYNGMIIE